MTRMLALGAMVLACGVAISGQQAPQRDTPFVPTTGSATISGVVVNDEEKPQPVRRAILTLTGTGLRPSRAVVTDDDGRFVLRNLPAGRFTLTVMRAAFITSVYGAKRPGRPGTPIVVADGANVAGLTVKLWRGAVVAGVVRDVNGAPAPGVPVRAISAKPSGAGPLASLTNNGARTNEAGEFRIFGLEPGKYVVAAEPASGGSTMIALLEAQVDSIFDAIKRGSATPAAPPPAMPTSTPFDYAPIFYPSAVSIAQAAPLTLAAGQEISGLDLTLQRVPRSSVSGIVTRPDGTPAADAAVQLTTDAVPGPFDAGPGATLDTTTGPDGSFRIAQVAPGNYTLMARAQAGAPPPSTPGLVTPGPVGPQLWATTSVSVGSGNIEGLALTVAPGFTVSGSVVFRGDKLPAPKNPALRITIAPTSFMSLRPGTPITSIAFVPGASVRPDGSFEIANLPPGRFRILLSGTPIASGDWQLQSAIVGERDVLDGDFEITGGGQASMTLTLSDGASELSGVLQTASGTPGSDVFVIAYSADRALWVPGTRRVQAVRPDVDGRYSIRGLPAGDYLLAALLDVDQDDWQEAGFLDRLVPASIKLSIAKGEKKTQDLRIGR